MDGPRFPGPTGLQVDNARLEGDDLMGSAPVSGSFESRLGSSARRGAYVSQGMPGVYRVTRSRTVQAPSLPRTRRVANPWHRSPQQVYSLAGTSYSVAGETISDDPDATSVEAAQATWYATPDFLAGPDDPLFSRVEDHGIDGISFQALIAQVAWVFDASPVAALTYTPPEESWPSGANGVEVDPDGSSVVLSTLFTGHWQMRFPTDNDPEGHALASGAVLSRLGTGAYSGATPVWVDGATVDAAALDTLAPIDAATAVGHGPVETFIVDSGLPDGNDKVALVIALDLITSETPIHQQQGIGCLVEALGGGSTFGLSVTYQPPRYRYTYPSPGGGGSGTWIPSSARGGYVWDAGLYIPTDFDSLIGFPTGCPASAAEIDFLVAPPAFDAVADASTPSPSALVANSGSQVGPFRTPGGANTPDAGSHLWLIWYGPAFDESIDPEPDEAPSGLVPAALAADGTG